MGVSVEGGKGRGKSMGVDLNLVPFIDFMSCLIAFLMIAAVWTQIASLDVEQSISNSPPVDTPPPETPPVPPLTVHVKAEGHWIGRKVEEGVQVPKVGETYDYAKLRELMTKDHETYPVEEMVVINTDDGVPYEEMIQVLDLSREIGYPKTLLAGGPPSATPAEGAAPMPSGG
jgi:biopolymer transport protein TolR